jgi:hypothetical protein
MRTLRGLVLAAALAAGTLLAGGNPAVADTGCQGWMMHMPNSGFEDPTNGSVAPYWCGEGPDPKGVDTSGAYSATGANSGYLLVQQTGGRWNALTQHIVVPANDTIELSAMVRTTANVTAAYFGVRDKATSRVHTEIRFGALTGYTRLSVRFSSGASNNYTAFVGYWSPSGLSWLVVDDFATRLVR